MTIDEIIKLAREAGLYLDGENTQQPFYVLSPSELERFASLVRNAALEEAAGVCEELDKEASWKEGRPASGRECAAAIQWMKEQA